MGLFGQYANVYKSVQDTLRARTKTLTTSTGLANVERVSELKPWIRISSAVNNGLIIGTGISLDPSFNNLYGTLTKSGKIGNDFSGNPVNETSTVKARGYRPSPIIESIGIENGSEGLSRKLKFQIKCFSLPQLDTITQYFLEPRYYLLAEWGWNTTNGYSGLANIEGPGINKAVCEMITYMNLGTLKEKRSKSQGHYDAFLGVITGGGINFGDDETYIIDVEVTTQGEIPAYLQQHKGTPVPIDAEEGSVNKSSIAFNIQSDIEQAETDGDYGRALFMYMFNDLPAQKQTESIKNLINQTITEVSKQQFVDVVPLQNDPEMKYWAQEWQYINMNSTYRDNLRQILTQGATIALKGKTVEFNGEQPLVSDARYIRMELAWKILNDIGKNDIIQNAFSCDGKNVNIPNHTISIDTTICRAHKHMFSTNREFLVIPNEFTPDFGLEAILSDPVTGNADTGFLVIEAGILKTIDIRMENLPGTYRFPRGITFKEWGAGFGEEYDESYRLIDKPAGSWGYLKDLYINFDFFVDCLNTNGALIKDIAIDILNGLSQAVNMFWDFQIVEIGSTNKNDVGLQKLVVVDANFSGLPVGSKVASEEDTQSNTLSLPTIGINSPFLDVSMKLEVKGAMANQIMAQRNNILNGGGSNSSATVEDKVEDFTGLFSGNSVDHLTVKINQIQSTNSAAGGSAEPGSVDSDVEVIIGSDANGEIIKYRGETYYGTPQSGTPGSGTGFYTPAKSARQKVDEERRRRASSAVYLQNKANWIMFLQKAVVVSKKNNPELIDFEEIEDSDNLFNLEENDASFYDLKVVCWEDSQLLRQVYEYDMKSGTNNRFEPKTNPGYLPIEVEFTIHGISGFKVGDMIHFTDLPHVYRNKIFTVMNVTQVIDGDIWKTTVTTACRNLDVGETYLEPTPLPGTPGSNQDPQGNQQGQPTPTPPAPSGQITDPGNIYWPPGQEPAWANSN
jgi:hypothetical protein